MALSPRQLLSFNHLADLYRPTIVTQGSKKLPGPYELVEAGVPCRFEKKSASDLATLIGRLEGDVQDSVDNVHLAADSPVDDNWLLVNKSLDRNGNPDADFNRVWVCRGQPQRFSASARRQGGKVVIKASQEARPPVGLAI
jgi:hypothetical protein